MAIQLNFTKEQPKIVIGEAGVEILPSGNQFFIEVRNESPTTLRNVKGSIGIFNSSNQLEFKRDLGPFTIAPFTLFQFPALWDGKTFQAGDYIASIRLEIGGNVISEERTFTISEQQVRQYIEQMPQNHTFVIEPGMPWWSWLFIGLGVLLLIGLSYFIGKRK
jgi:hypothetical protein